MKTSFVRSPESLDGWFEEYFDKALKDLTPTSSVGMCNFRFLGTTIEEALGGNPRDGTADPERVEMLKQSVRLRLSNLRNPDPIRIFVKHEPHKVSKLVEGRLRLISAVSLVDAMVDRVLFIWFAEKVLASAGTNSMAIGWSPTAGGYRWVWEIFRGSKGTRGLDMTAWDWVMPPWLILAIRDTIKDFAICAPDFWKDAVDVRWETLFRDAVFCFGDGSIVQQPDWGIMKSGCFLTIIMNTLSQLIRHHLVIARLRIPRGIRTIFLGDDQAVEDFPEFSLYESETRRLGFKLKDSSVDHGRVHFAGFISGPNFVEPEYREKHVYLVTHTPTHELPDRLQAYQYLYAHVDGYFDWIQRELAEVSPTLVIRRWMAKAFMNGFNPC